MPGESGKRVKIAVVWGSSEMEKIGQNAIRLDEMENGKNYPRRTCAERRGRGGGERLYRSAGLTLRHG